MNRLKLRRRRKVFPPHLFLKRNGKVQRSRTYRKGVK